MSNISVSLTTHSSQESSEQPAPEASNKNIPMEGSSSFNRKTMRPENSDDNIVQCSKPQLTSPLKPTKPKHLGKGLGVKTSPSASPLRHGKGSLKSLSGSTTQGSKRKSKKIIVGSPDSKQSGHVLSGSANSKVKQGKGNFSLGGDNSTDSSTCTSFHDESDFTNNTALFEKNLDVYRKFRVAVRETEDCIQTHHDRALRRVQERVMKETLESKIEVESRLLKEESSRVKQSYILEVDAAKEDTEQLRALKLYHRMHVQRLLPLWFRSLNDCTECIAANGHSDKLQWRSKSRKILLFALNEMDDDDSSGAVKAKVRYLALSINARKAQQVLNILKNIRGEYIRQKEGVTDLGHHSSELRRVTALLHPDKPCLLQRGQWSTDLESSVSNVKHRNETSLIKHGALGLGGTVSLDDEEFTLGSTDGCPTPQGLRDRVEHDSYAFSAMEEDTKSQEVSSKNIFSVEPLRNKGAFMLSTSSTPVDPHNGVEITRLLREASSQGFLQEAWKVFSHFYGEYINNVKDKTFVHMNLKSVPTLETFKLLIMAFKNSDSTQYDDVATIFLLMKRAGVQPDLELFNMILRSCERRGAWRRALKYLKSMKTDYGIMPSTNSFGIVIDSCRHAPETPAAIFDTLRNEKFPRKFCYQAAACNAGNRISTVAATDLFVETFQNESDFNIQNVGVLRRAVTAADVASSANDPSKQWGIFNDKMSKSLNWKSPAFHRTGPSVPAFQSQVLKIIAPQEKLISANTNVKSGALLGCAGVDAAASTASVVTFDTFDDSFASFKDLNRSCVRGVELEDSVYDASIAAAPPSAEKTKK